MQKEQLQLCSSLPVNNLATSSSFRTFIEQYNKFGRKTDILEFSNPEYDIPVYINEFWTSKQRAAHSLHEISYRACFKPQLPRFFISRLSAGGDLVYDPFMGRGTTLIEAALLGRVPAGCDINPLSKILTLPRLNPPELSEVSRRLQQIDLQKPVDTWDELLVFYHPLTLQAITNLRNYLLEKEKAQEQDHVDAWIRMVATNRLTGHSKGFFSVYTLPPNQAVSIKSQKRINNKRAQSPPMRDVKEIILRKSRSLLRKLTAEELKLLRKTSNKTKIITGSSDQTPLIDSNSVKLVVTSPPFLDTVNYQADNWLRCWFNGIDASSVRIWQLASPSQWKEKMFDVFKELVRILMPGGHIAFEVGEVRGGKILLENLVVPAAVEVGLRPTMIIINSQKFTKTANCWGVKNLKKGTNTNRIVLLRKDA